MRAVRSRRRGRGVATPAVVAPAVLTVALLATAVVSVQVAAPVTAAPAADQKTPPSTTLTSASSPGWRVVATIGPRDGQTTGVLTATSARLAWSVWRGTNFTAVERWTGSGWKPLPLPAKFDSYVRSEIAFGGNSANDFWLFNSHSRTRVLRWTGTAWKLQSIPSWVLSAGSPVTAAVFGPANVWLFSLGAGAFAAHYNGLGWTKVKLPAVPTDVTALGAGDIWALAAQLGKATALHWNGRTWSKSSIPSTAHIPDGFGPLIATGQKSAWVWRTELLPGPRTVADVLHWNGTAWKKVASTPADIINSVAADGAGGLWASGIDINPGGFDLFYHLVGGRWTLVNTPASVWNHAAEYLTWIPGTRSLWAVASGLTPKGVIDTVILKYGP
jgi:hypothetical protein